MPIVHFPPRGSVTQKQKIALVIALILFLAFGTTKVVHVVKNNTSVIGANPPRDNLGAVRAVPETLRASAEKDLISRGRRDLLPLTLDAYSLARALRSEHGKDSREVRTWIAWAIKNSAHAAGKTIHALLVLSKAPTSGLYADQKTDSRYAATGQGPRLEDLEIADEVLHGSGKDPTRGATNFFSPKTQNALYRLAKDGDPRYAGRITTDANGIREKWAARGLQSRGAPPSAGPGVVEFFGKGVA